MKRPRPFKPEHGSSKRRLISSLEGLSLQPQHEKVFDNASNDDDDTEYMDTSSPNTVFIPSIDRFLLDEEEEFEPLPNRLLNIPQSVKQEIEQNIPHYYQWPTLQLIIYEPIEVTIWKHMWPWQVYKNVNGPANGGDDDIDMDMDIDTGNEDAEMMDLDD